MTRDSNILHLRRRFGSYEEFNAGVRAWATDFRQVGRGLLEARMAQQIGRDINLLQIRFNRSVAMTGAPPPGTLTFGVVGVDAGVSWNGHEVHPHQVLFFPGNREFVSLSPAGFVGRTVSVRSELFESVAESLGYRDLPSRLSTLRDPLSARHEGVARLVAQIDSRRKTARVMLRIVEDLVLLLAEDRPDTTVRGRTSYTGIVDDAISFIVDNARDAPTVGEICSAVGVSLRTLNRAFNSRLGHGPKECVQSVRLHGVRRDLLEAEPQARIHEIAGSWGFWHMGDLALQYRQEFGELPSDTRET